MLDRAQKNAKKMPIKDAVHQLGNRLTPEVHALIQRNSTSMQPASQAIVNSNSGTSMGGWQDSKVFGKAMAFLNEEFKAAREKMDIKLFECGFFKLEKEGLLYETQDTLDQIAQDISLQEATIEKCNGEIEQLNLSLAKVREELRIHLFNCATIRKELEYEKSIIEEDLRVINLILEVTMEECKDQVKPPFLIQACVSEKGSTVFQTDNEKINSKVAQLKTSTAQMAFQQMMFQVYGGTSAELPGQLSVSGLFGGDDDGGDDDEIGMVGAGAFVQTD